MSMHRLLDDYAMHSPLRHVSTRLKLVLVAVVLVVGVSSTSPIAPLFIALSMSIATVWLGGVPPRFYAKLVLAPLGFGAAGALVILLFFGQGDAVLSLEVMGHTLSASTEGVNMAAVVLSRTVGGMCTLFFLALTTPMVELFSELKALRVPTSVVELSMMIYRYIFVFLEEAIRMRHAQIMRLGYGSLKSSIRSFSMLASTLFIRTWEQGEKLYIAMDSRCYGGKLSLLEHRNPMKGGQVLTVCAYVVLIFALAYITKNVVVV